MPGPDMHYHGNPVADPGMYHHSMLALHLMAAHGVAALAVFGAVLGGAAALPHLRRAFHRE